VLRAIPVAIATAVIPITRRERLGRRDQTTTPFIEKRATETAL
jgi:hypothetical protein